MKKLVNKKGLLVTISLLFLAILIGITSFASAGIDASYWTSEKFLFDTIFTTSLVLIGIVCGQAEGDNFFRTNEKGLFVSTYNTYNTKRSMVENYVDKFGDWNYHLYRKEYYEKCIRYLLDENGIRQAKLILQLDRCEIMRLNEPQAFFVNGEERYFNSLTEKQIQAILNVLDGKIKVKYIHDSYFLNAYTKNGNKSMYEEAGSQQARKRKTFMVLTAYRVILTILVSMVLTAFVFEQNDGVDKAQAFYTLLLRYFTLFSSVSWGIFIANDLIKEDCVFLDYKSTTLHQFYLDVVVNKTFVAKTEEEKAFEKIKNLMEEGEASGEQREKSIHS